MSVQDLAGAVAAALAVALLLSAAWIDAVPTAKAASTAKPVSAAQQLACVEGGEHGFLETHSGDYCPIPGR